MFKSFWDNIYQLTNFAHVFYFKMLWIQSKLVVTGFDNRETHTNTNAKFNPHNHKMDMLWHLRPVETAASNLLC